MTATEITTDMITPHIPNWVKQARRMSRVQVSRRIVHPSNREDGDLSDNDAKYDQALEEAFIENFSAILMAHCGVYDDPKSDTTNGKKIVQVNQNNELLELKND